MSSNKYEIDMCNGPIMRKLISFSLPLMISGVLQLLFNIVDIIVVGRFGGSESLAAVGSTTSLIHVFTNLFIGISLGANVMTARYLAAHQEEEVSKTVHTAIGIALYSGIAMIVVGLLFSRTALEWMGTPEDVIEKSSLYIRIYFAGMPFFMLYNYGAAILRAVGDTKRPLIFLIIAGVVNALLNMFLVIIVHLDVAGVAIATVISQLISCVLVLQTLMKSEGAYRLYLSKIKIHGKYLGRIFQIGIPAGIQSTLIGLSNVLLQSSVNSFGSIAMAGYTAAGNIHSLLYIIVNSVTQACMSFTSQNYGAHKPERMDRVLLECILLQCIVQAVLGPLAYVFGPQILRIYTSDQQVIARGMEVLVVSCIPYFLCGIMDLLPGALRGMGHSGVPMILSLLGTVGTRVVWVFWLFPQHRSLDYLFLSYPVSWIVTILMQTICYYFVRRQVRNELKNDLQMNL